LGQRFLRLAAPDGCLLDADRLSGLQNGDSLAAIALQPKIAATCAFALWVVGGDKIVGAIPTMVVTAPKSMSSGVFSRFVAQRLLLLQFWQMEP
jgi:hypothetical protein